MAFNFSIPVKLKANAYDYIIVGAGSAGCALAARLSEDARTRVLLLEAGGADTAREIHIPAAFSRLFKTAVDWNYSTEPEPHLHNRRLYWPRGKVLGGSSSMNAMIYIRGNAADYDHWRDLGNCGWAFADVLPYFKKSENQQRGESEFHGADGPVTVADPECVNPLTRAFLAAANEAGIPSNPDFNGATQQGAGLHQLTQKNGARCSSVDAYLKPALARPNLTVLTGVHATRLAIENDRARGVIFLRNGATETAHAKAEVILAGGAINSPQLLLLSGIGPADDLKKLGIDALQDLPGVGQNLQDHPMVSVGYLCTRKISLDGAETLANILRYWLFKSGPLTSNVAEAGLFVNTRDGSAVPDLQLLFGPAYYRGHGLVRRAEHCFGFGPTLITPESRGSISLRSTNPQDPPAIRANYLSTEADLQTMIEGVRLSRRLAHAKAFEAFRGEELHPGPLAQSQDDIVQFLRNELETLYHPVGTCKMGNDGLAVVDERLKVHGINCLRVVDASIMPRIPAGNTNATVVMIAEKAADMIRGNA
ncbi:MAG: choline dehydrogenase [Candidatus Acidiferrales bacterium]